MNFHSSKNGIRKTMTKNVEILGVHLVEPRATDLIAKASLAIQMEGRIQELADTIHTHITLSEIILETLFKALDRAFHG